MQAFLIYWFISSLFRLFQVSSKHQLLATINACFYSSRTFTLLQKIEKNVLMLRISCETFELIVMIRLLDCVNKYQQLTENRCYD